MTYYDGIIAGLALSYPIQTTLLGAIIDKHRAFSRSLTLAALLALFIALPAQSHSTKDSPIPASVSATVEVVAGTVQELVIEDRVNNTTRSYYGLQRDDGTTVLLTGPGAEALQDGARVEVRGRQSGAHFAVHDVQALSPPSRPDATVTLANAAQVEGTLRIIHADDFATGRSQFLYHVHDAAGRITTLSIAALPAVLRGGSRVIVSGKRGADALSLQPQRITILTAPAEGTEIKSDLTPQATTINSVLLILANFNNTVAPSYTSTQAQQVMSTDTYSVANFYNENSYGQQPLNVTVTSSWVTMNRAADCNWSMIGPAAEAAALAADPAYNAANYNFVVYLFPAQSCGWSGLAYVGFPHKSWINGTGAFRTQVVAHEMGHNFGLLHAGSLNCGAVSIGGSCGVAEYGDPFDTMGNSHAMHFNARQKSLLNWIPAASVKAHTSGSVNYTLDPIESVGGSVYAVKIPTASSLRTYWLEFRQPIGFDSPSNPAANFSWANNGAQIRVANPFEWASGSDDTEIVDMTPATSGNLGDAALLVGQSYLDSTYGINVIVTGASASALTVSVTTSTGTATTTTLTSSSNPSMFGTNVTFTATVTGINPTGTVNFKDGGGSIAACSAVALTGSGNSRTAACTTNTLAGGTHSIIAMYSGDAVNATSSSAALSQTVDKAPSTTGIGSSLTPSTFGTSVTFTATVSGSGPTGTVDFKDGATSIAGCSAVALTGGSGNIRTAACATSSLAVGTHSITAVYSGDVINNSSTSTIFSQVVNSGGAATTTTLSSSANPSTVGANVTFTATVSGSAPTGTVNFKDGAASIAACSAVALTGSGNIRTAACVTSSLGVGTHSISAVYSGDATNNASTSTTFSQVVNPAPSTSALSSSANPSVAGASVTFTASVTGFAPTGSVNFTDGGSSIAGCAAVALTGSGNTRTAACATSSLSAATHSIVASYGGDANNTASASAPLSQVVNSGGAATTTTLWSSSNPSTVGTNVTFTATVSGSAPTGTVNFKDGAGSIAGCSAVALAGIKSPTAACTTNTLAGGTHGISAVYSGDASNNGSTSTNFSQVVNPAPSTSALSSSANPSMAGASVTFTASVTGFAPTGSVNFTDGGSSIAGCAAVALTGSGNTRTAACSTSSLSAATHAIVANYGGDANNTASASAPLSQVVNSVGTATTTTLSSSSNPSVAGASVTFTATVSGTSPTGTANFKDGAASIAGCAAVALTGSGNTRTAACTTNTLTVGAHSIVATYSGDAANATSSSTALAQTVNKATSTIGIGSSLTPSTAGANVTFTATVSGSAPTGTVDFKDGIGSISACSAVALTGSGNIVTATCTTSSLGVATHSISAVYSGDASNNGSTSTTFLEVVNPAPDTATLSSSANPSMAGASVTFTASVTGFAPTGSVNFTDGGSSIAGCAAVALTGSGNTRTAACATSSLSAATHSIVASYGGDANNTASTSAVLSQVVNSVAPPASLVNAGFEIPALGSGGYQYNPSGAGIGWTFSSQSGVQHNGSAWKASIAPDGTQTAFIQGIGTISQTLNLSAGSYTLSFKAALRPCCVAPYVQPIRVTVDGTQIGGLVSPASSSFTAFSIPFSVASTGAHTITFTGTDPNDKTTFIDSVTVQ